MKAKVFEIKKFAVHDGDGIRTTVFLKGCPLKCVWCHNPESISSSPQLAFYKSKCSLCGNCVNICPVQAHSIRDNVHTLDRNKCVACGKCQDVCYNGALTLYGKEMSVEEVLPALLEDKDFYETSGGGITISGGECLIHADFCRELLKAVKAEGINTAIDTCGLVSKDAIDKVIPYTDVFLYDFKAFDENVHIKCTGQSNKQILENLKYIDDCGKDIEIRIPFVPGYNSDQIERIAQFMSTLKHLTKVRVLPYHNFAGSKYESLDMENTLPETLPTNEELEKAKNAIRSFGIKVMD